MLGRFHRSPPKRHDTVAHVFIDGAPVVSDQSGQTTENPGQQGLQLDWLHGFGHLGEAPHVAKHHRHFTAGRLHAVAGRIFDHLVNQLGRHVGTKKIRQFAFGPALDKIAVTHVQGERGNCHRERARQRENQAVPKVQPKVHRSQNSDDNNTQDHRPCGRNDWQGEGQDQTGQHQHQDLVTNCVIRLDQNLAIEQTGYDVGVRFHAGIDLAHRGNPQVLQARGSRSHQDDLVLQLARGQCLGQ